MKKHRKENIYRTLTSPKELIKLHEQAKSSVYRQAYHIQPVSGLLNDPNGFIFHNGIWHLFYQWYPWGAVHGIKYWYHITSKNLVTWENKGISLRPNTYFDNSDCFSGTAIARENDILLYYTGIHRNGAESPVIPYTCHARMSPDGFIHKYSAPLFGPQEGYTHNQRDPKIIYSNKTDKYYLFIGGESETHHGCILVYASDEPDHGWIFQGKLNVPGFEEFGYMWECPSFLSIGMHDVLIFCPQGIRMDSHGKCMNHNGYIIGSMDFKSLTFTPDGSFHLLDFGFDSYAAQCINDPENPDRAVLIAWMGLPDAKYPTDSENWSGSLTLPRELSIRHKRLIQRPIQRMKLLRKYSVNPCFGMLPSAAEIDISIYPKDYDMRLFSKADGSGGFHFHYDSEQREITLDRSGMNLHINPSFGETRNHKLESELTHFKVFIDHSSIEIFVNNGDAVFSSRIFPKTDEHYYQISECRSISIWEMEPGVKDTFIL